MGAGHEEDELEENQKVTNLCYSRQKEILNGRLLLSIPVLVRVCLLCLFIVVKDPPPPHLSSLPPSSPVSSLPPFTLMTPSCLTCVSLSPPPFLHCPCHFCPVLHVRLPMLRAVTCSDVSAFCFTLY